jgi:hypothetical protein
MGSVSASVYSSLFVASRSTTSAQANADLAG